MKSIPAVTFPVAVLLACCLAVPVELSADELSQKDKDLFEIHVRPTLVAHCIKCHGATKQEGGLRLTSLAEILEGGDSGPAIVPGAPGESLMMEALRYESYEMPPDGQLDEKLVTGVEAWIAAGAPWPLGNVLTPPPRITDQDREWWCYQSIADPKVPEVKDNGWGRNEIDRFIFDRLSREGIQPADEAEPRTLARRVHFAVTGLPPNGVAIREPNAKASGITGAGSTPAGPEASAYGSRQTLASFDYESLVDQLLDDPAYGENQARYWLDLVRYAETDGYRADGARPEAHHYRDYVIRSFNDDKPYDRFVTEQLAGDEVDPGNRDALIGTMFLRHWIYEWNQRDVEQQWQEILNDITETTADVFLAQGLKCARCHDHKFDPLLQKDFFRLQGFFAAFQPREDQPIADLDTRTAHLKQTRAWEDATAEIRQRLHEIEHPVLLAHATKEGFNKFVTEIQSMISKRPDERAPYEHQVASLAARQFDLHPDKLSQWLTAEQEAERQQLLKRLSEFDSLKPEPLPTLKFVVSDVGPIAPPTFIPDDPDKTPIAPGAPTILNAEPAEIVAPPEALQSTGRRMALARWITDPTNPLTARVIVNRIWQQHFGHGLAPTSSDFGHLGLPPSHPELLDWLASRFIEDGWSLKKLHRRILTSTTYRQTSLRPADDRLAELDPSNTLLWRMNPRRLAGEEITDAVLSASGELKSQKRAIYKPVRRNNIDPLLALFDMPDRIRSSGSRHQTTTSTQALLLTNGEWTHQRATAMAARFAAANDVDLIRSVHETLYGRQPKPLELDLASRFLSGYRAITSVDSPSLSDAALTKMPGGTEGQALDVSPESFVRVSLPFSDTLPDGDFTIEAVVMLRSLYKDASVRTIAAHWDGNQTHPGWSFGVTSTTSRYQPRNLILQLVGKADDGELHYEVIPSDLRPELDKPYYLAVSVKLSDISKQGITFYMQDLSRAESELQTAHVAHEVNRDFRPNTPLGIGGRMGTHVWDGLIDRIQIHNAALSTDEIRAEKASTQFADWKFEDAAQLGHDSSSRGNHATVSLGKPSTKTQSDLARIALIHALLNSNELIYVD